MKEAFKYGIILGLICFLASGILALVYSVAEPKIKLQKEKMEKAALKEVMPQGEYFEAKFEDGKAVYYLAYDANGALVGFVIRAEGKGYSSKIETFSGVGFNFEISNIKILSQNETPGLGNRITFSSFLEQFRGKTADSIDKVQAITGATISSKAVIDSVKDKISGLKEQLSKEIKNGR